MKKMPLQLWQTLWSWVVSLSSGPHHCPPLYQSALFTFRWFFFFFLSHCFESLQRKLMCPWREVCAFKTWRERRELFESLVFHVANRQESCRNYPLYLGGGTSHYKDQYGLECIAPRRASVEFSGWKENRPSGKVARFVFDAPGLTRRLTLTGSFVQAHAKSPGAGTRGHNHV